MWAWSKSSTCNLKADLNATFAEIVFQTLCKADHHVTACDTSYMSAACCRQESQAVGYLQRAWGACHVCLHCWKPPTWQAHALPGGIPCLHLVSLHPQVNLSFTHSLINSTDTLCQDSEACDCDQGFDSALSGL